MAHFTIDEMDDGSRYICPADGPQPGLTDRRSDDPTDIFAECPQCGLVLRPRLGSEPVPPFRYSWEARPAICSRFCSGGGPDGGAGVPAAATWGEPREAPATWGAVTPPVSLKPAICNRFSSGGGPPVVDETAPAALGTAPSTTGLGLAPSPAVAMRSLSGGGPGTARGTGCVSVSLGVGGWNPGAGSGGGDGASVEDDRIFTLIDKAEGREL